MKCPECGAENVDRAIYCGSCAAQMKETGPTVRGEVVPDGPDLPPQIAKLMDGSHLVRHLMIICIFLGLGAAFSLARGEGALPEVAVLVGVIASEVTLFILGRRLKNTARTVKRHVSYGRPEVRGAVVASARSLSLPGLVAIAGFGAIGAGLALFGVYESTTSSGMGWVVSLAMGGIFLVVAGLMTTRAANEVTLSRDGIDFYSPSAKFHIRFERDNIAEMTMKGRVLRVVLKEVPFGMTRRSHHMVLGRAHERAGFAQAVQSITL